MYCLVTILINYVYLTLKLHLEILILNFVVNRIKYFQVTITGCVRTGLKEFQILTEGRLGYDELKYPSIITTCLRQLITKNTSLEFKYS